MATNTDIAVRAILHNQIEIMKHLGLKAENPYTVAAQAEANAVEYWGVGGNGWRMQNGLPPKEAESEVAQQEGDEYGEYTGTEGRGQESGKDEGGRDDGRQLDLSLATGKETEYGVRAEPGLSDSSASGKTGLLNAAERMAHARAARGTKR